MQVNLQLEKLTPHYLKIADIGPNLAAFKLAGWSGLEKYYSGRTKILGLTTFNFFA